MKPFVTSVSDYHDFDDVLRHFDNAGIKLMYAEVGCGNSEFWRGPRGAYHAVFFTELNDEANELISKWKSHFEEDNGRIGKVKKRK